MTTSTRTGGAVRHATIPSPRPAEDDTVVLEPGRAAARGSASGAARAALPLARAVGFRPGRAAAVGVLGRGDGELALARPEPGEPGLTGRGLAQPPRRTRSRSSASSRIASPSASVRRSRT